MKISRLHRFGAVLLAGCMLAGTMAGCGGSGGGESSAPSDNSEPVKAAYDFNGETIKIIDVYEYMKMEDEKGQARLAQVQKDFNCTIKKVKATGNYGNAVISSIVSGSPLGHILSGRESELAEWHQSSVFADLTEGMKKSGIDFSDTSVYDQVARQYTNVDGQQLGFGRYSPLYLNGVWMFNKRIFKEMNLEDPYTLYKEGKWTWDKVEELAEKATVRKSDGTVSQWGLASYMATPMVADMIMCNGGSIAGFTPEGKPNIRLKDPKTVEALERFRSWAVIKKILRTNDGSEVWDTVYKEFPNGNIAIFAGNPLSYAIEANMKDEYGFVGAPMGSSATEYIEPRNSFAFFFVPKTYESQADRLIALMDALWRPEEGKSAAERITEEYAENLYDKESLEFLIDQAQNPRKKAFDAFGVFNLEWTAPSLSDMMSGIINGSTSVGDSIASMEPMLGETAADVWMDLVYTGK